jgi:hypothetical protein
VTRNNTIIFSSISNDTLQIDQQFTRYNHLSYFIVGCLVLDGVRKLYAVFLCSEFIRELHDNWVSYISVLTSLTMCCCTLQLVDFVLLFLCYYFLHRYIMCNECSKGTPVGLVSTQKFVVQICLSFFVHAAVRIFHIRLQQNVIKV